MLLPAPRISEIVHLHANHLYAHPYTVLDLDSFGAAANLVVPGVLKKRDDSAENANDHESASSQGA